MYNRQMCNKNKLYAIIRFTKYQGARYLRLEGDDHVPELQEGLCLQAKDRRNIFWKDGVGRTGHRKALLSELQPKYRNGL